VRAGGREAEAGKVRRNVRAGEPDASMLHHVLQPDNDIDYRPYPRDQNPYQASHGGPLELPLWEMGRP
jgi:hypothetical protein